MKNVTKLKSANNRKGFTILELIVVIAVIGTLMLIVFAGGSALQTSSKTTLIKSDLTNYQTMLKSAFDAYPALTETVATTEGSMSTVGVVNTSGGSLSDLTDSSTGVTQMTIEEVLDIYLEDSLELEAADTSDGTNISGNLQSTGTDGYSHNYDVYWTAQDAFTNSGIVIVSEGSNKTSTKDDFMLVIGTNEFGDTKSYILTAEGDGIKSDTSNKGVVYATYSGAMEWTVDGEISGLAECTAIVDSTSYTGKGVTINLDNYTYTFDT